MTAVFVVPLGYPLHGALRFCRLLTIGTQRHVTACRASIPADEPVLITAQRPPDPEICSACLADLRIRLGRDEDLAPYAVEIGQRAELTTDEPLTSRTVTPDLRRPVVGIDLGDMREEDW